MLRKNVKEKSAIIMNILNFILLIVVVLLAAIFVFQYFKKIKIAKQRHEIKTAFDKLVPAKFQEAENLKQEAEKLSAELDKKQKSLNTLKDETMSSLRYARRIQEAAFTQDSELLKIFPEAFIYTLTHSTVSGDFYKAFEIQNFKVFALADCAGHGIPGGFLTMLGISILKEQLSERYTDEMIHTSEILEKMRESIISSLNSGQSNSESINDGLNITLVAFNKNNDNLLFSGANQHLYIFSGGKINILKGDKIPVGWSMKGNLPFTEQSCEIKKGDMVFFTTDSLQSQFGGDKDQKFGSKRLEKMFEEIGQFSALEQKKYIGSTVEQWVKGHIQVDDISLAGIRI